MRVVIACLDYAFFPQFDEALPDEMETFHGGYYVNCGQLEFKKVETVEENSEAEELRVAKKKVHFTILFISYSTF